MSFISRNKAAIARYSIGLAVIVLTFYFLGRNLASNWNDLRSEELDIQPALLVLSGCFLAGDIMMRSIVWWDLTGYFAGDARPPYPRMAKVFLYSWIGRYVPGKVAYLVGRFYLGRAAGVPSRALVGGIAYENVLVLIMAMVLSALLLVPSLAVESESFWPYLALPAAAIGGVALLHPAVLSRVLRLAMRLTGRDLPDSDWILPARRMARTLALSAIVFSLSGVGFYLMVASLTNYPARYLPLAAGAMTLGAVVGSISIITPAGLGVREGVLVGILQFTMPRELAVLVAVVARVWATVVDLALVGLCFAFDYVSGDRLLFAAFRSRSDDGLEIETAPALES
ncbi:MAG: lysylphosphatidylglycerol synthase domain-containing protein [Dehalococcoidia bacterium]